MKRRIDMIVIIWNMLKNNKNSRSIGLLYSMYMFNNVYILLKIYGVIKILLKVICKREV